jgi:hypothetical protein
MLFVFLIQNCKQVKTSKKIIAGIGLATVVGLVIYLVRRHKSNRIRKEVAEQVAEHGYETAQDILFPKKGRKGRRDSYGRAFSH